MSTHHAGWKKGGRIGCHQIKRVSDCIGRIIRVFSLNGCLNWSLIGFQVLFGTSANRYLAIPETSNNSQGNIKYSDYHEQKASINPHQLIFPPDSLQPRPVPPQQHPLAPHHVILETSLENLPVRKVQLALSVFAVLRKLALVLDPILIGLFPVAVVNGGGKVRDFFVIEGAAAPELVIFPFAIVGDFVIGVIEYPSSVHFVFFPLTNILAAFVVIENAFAVTHAVVLGALVPASDVGFGHVLQLAFGLFLLEVAPGLVASFFLGLIQVEGHGVAGVVAV